MLMRRIAGCSRALAGSTLPPKIAPVNRHEPDKSADDLPRPEEPEGKYLAVAAQSGAYRCSVGTAAALGTKHVIRSLSFAR